MAMTASIPSPPFEVIELGPFTIRMYGVCIALGVLAAVLIVQHRYAEKGGNPDDVGRLAVWAVPAGVVGARIYHVATDYERFQDDWLDAFRIWKGGLGVWGGIALGTIVGAIVAKRRHLDMSALLYATAPALPVAQAIGRLGNWFNQELFGRPTDVPWALQVDPEHRPEVYAAVETFHATFLYEALWNLGLAAFLVWGVPRIWANLQPGRLFALYVIGYTAGRAWIEALRIDDSRRLLGLRFNIWTSLAVGGFALAYFVWAGRRPSTGAAPQGDTEQPASEPAG
jgi:prolipoprotein diacylglyceryl transferase